MSKLQLIDPTPHIVACMIFLFLTTLKGDMQCTVIEDIPGMKPIVQCEKP